MDRIEKLVLGFFENKQTPPTRGLVPVSCFA